MISIVDFLKLYSLNALFTHPNCRAVARHAGALVVECDDVNCVCFTAVQVVPRASGGVCGALVDMAVLSHRYGQVGLCIGKHGPADGAEAVLAAHVALQLFRDAGTWRVHQLLPQCSVKLESKTRQMRGVTCFVFFWPAYQAPTSIILCYYGEIEQLSAWQIGLYHCVICLESWNIPQISSGCYHVHCCPLSRMPAHRNSLIIAWSTDGQASWLAWFWAMKRKRSIFNYNEAKKS